MSLIHGTVWWSELMTREVASARAYYAQVCGWRFETTETGAGTYYIAHAHGRPVAGIMDLGDMPALDDMPPHWIAYLAVDDLDTALRDAETAGGETLRAPFDVPDVGRIAILRDASGAAVGLIAPASEWNSQDMGNGALENVPV